MTFVLGINLSDRIYLAADTQVSDSSTQADRGHCMKIMSFADKDRTASISCAYAGDKKFIKYLVNEIAEACQNGRLSLDIFKFKEQITDFIKKATTKELAENLTKKAKIIFAGESLTPHALKRWDFGESMSRLMNEQGFRINDPHALTAMQFGVVECRPQHMFAFKIREATNEFGISDKGGGAYTTISAGSSDLTTQEEKDLLRFFLYHGDPNIEPTAIAEFLKSKFSTTIGGAVTMGIIGPKSKVPGHLIHFENEVSSTSWPVKHEAGKIYTIDRVGKKIDLITNFYQDGEIESLEL